MHAGVGWGEVIVRIDGNWIWEGVSGGIGIAYVEENYISDPQGGRLMAQIDGDFIRNFYSGQVLFILMEMQPL